MTPPNPNVYSAISASHYTKRKESKFLEFESKREKYGKKFFFFRKITNGAIKERKWSLRIRTLAQRFPLAIVRKGKNQSFSNLNPKERNLEKKISFFFERSLMAPPNPNVGSTISASHCTKRKEPKFL